MLKERGRNAKVLNTGTERGFLVDPSLFGPGNKVLFDPESLSII